MKIRKTIFTISLVASLISTSMTAVFADNYDDRLALAKDYTEATIRDLDMDRMIETMWRPVVTQVERTHGPVSQEKKDKIHALYFEHFAKDMKKVMLKQAYTMADVYTYDEIHALSEFYKTEHGRAAVIKLPQLLEAQLPDIIRMVQGRMNVVMPELLNILGIS